eukprot:4500545-Pleurochrysis_carterae.AAC.3
MTANGIYAELNLGVFAGRCLTSQNKFATVSLQLAGPGRVPLLEFDHEALSAASSFTLAQPQVFMRAHLGSFAKAKVSSNANRRARGEVVYFYV